MFETIGTATVVVMGMVILVLFLGKKIPEIINNLLQAIQNFGKPPRD